MGANGSPNPRYLVTGAYGCIGAWTVQQLVADGRAVVTFDNGTDSRRLRQLMSEQGLAGVQHVAGDITDADALERVIDDHGITNVIHLAALQVPFCRQAPALGARVNVVGTVNVFEAVSRRADRIGKVVYASSIAARGPNGELGPTANGDDGLPTTLYGTYKRANEGTAHVYWHDHGLASVGLRPHTVFGIGRDQGLTSAPTFAVLAATTGQTYRVPYGGPQQLQYAPDVARAFIDASDAAVAGAPVFDLGGDTTDVAELIAAIERVVPESAGTITFDSDNLLPFPSGPNDSGVEALIGRRSDTPLDDAIRHTVERFRVLLQRGLMSPDLD
jgi:UDP-glucuronate 4-epimerase